MTQTATGINHRDTESTEKNAEFKHSTQSEKAAVFICVYHCALNTLPLFSVPSVPPWFFMF